MDKWVVDQEFPHGHVVPMTADEEKAFLAYQAATTAAATSDTDRRGRVLQLARVIEDGTATAAQQRKALAACVRQLLITES